MPSALPTTNPPSELVAIVRDIPAVSDYYDSWSDSMGAFSDQIYFNPAALGNPVFMSQWNKLSFDTTELAASVRALVGFTNQAADYAVQQGWLTPDDVAAYWRGEERSVQLSGLNGLGLDPVTAALLVFVIIAIAYVAIYGIDKTAWAFVKEHYDSTFMQMQETRREADLLMQAWHDLPANQRGPLPQLPGMISKSSGGIGSILAGTAGMVGLGILGLLAFSFFGGRRK